MAVKEKLEEACHLYMKLDVASAKEPEIITLDKFTPSYSEDGKEEPIQGMIKNAYAAHKFVSDEEKYSVLQRKVGLVQDTVSTDNLGSEFEDFLLKEKQEKEGLDKSLEDYQAIFSASDEEEFNEVQTLCINPPHTHIPPFLCSPTIHTVEEQ